MPTVQYQIHFEPKRIRQKLMEVATTLKKQIKERAKERSNVSAGGGRTQPRRSRADKKELGGQLDKPDFKRAWLLGTLTPSDWGLRGSAGTEYPLSCVPGTGTWMYGPTAATRPTVPGAGWGDGGPLVRLSCRVTRTT